MPLSGRSPIRRSRGTMPPRRRAAVPRTRNRWPRGQPPRTYKVHASWGAWVSADPMPHHTASGPLRTREAVAVIGRVYRDRLQDRAIRRRRGHSPRNAPVSQARERCGSSQARLTGAGFAGLFAPDDSRNKTRCPDRTEQRNNGCRARGTITARARGGAGGPQPFPGEADAGNGPPGGRDSHPGR